MNQQKPERLDALIPGVIRQMSERHGALFEIQRDWPRLVGRRLAAHTRPASLRRGVLTVQTDRPGDSFAMSYRKPEALARLEAALPGKVHEILTRPA